jgi:hypothetical protein
MNKNIKLTILFLGLFILNNIIIRTYELYEKNIIYLFHLISVYVIIQSYSAWVKYNQYKRNVEKFSSEEQTIVFASFFIFIVFVKLFIFRDQLI